MIKLGNLKTGQTKELEDGTTVTKEDGHYKVVTKQGVAQLRFLKDERQWRFVTNGDVEYHLPEGTTGANAVEVLIANWPAAPAADEPKATESKPVDPREQALLKIQKLLAAGNDPTLAPELAEQFLAKAASLMAQHSIDNEEMRRAEGGDEGQGDDEIVEWAFQINVKGGHAPHRVAAYWPVVRAFGAHGYTTHYRPKGKGYIHHVVKLHVIAQADVIAKLRDFLTIMELAMEQQAEVVSRRESSRTRQNGGHHSLGGCHARRGFMRGFGQGIADRLSKSTRDYVAEDGTGSKALVVASREARVAAYMKAHHSDLKPARALQFDVHAYAEGRERGRSFASPAVTQQPAEREMINA